MSTPLVYVLTYCHNPSQLYGTTLVFESLRVGFPAATLCIIDNASIPEVRGAIKDRALACGATHHQLDKPWRHAEFIQQGLKVATHRSVVFVDPDVCFWEPIEHWEFDSLLAGRLIPTHFDMTTRCIAQARLHTSLLWCSNAPLLLHEIARLKSEFPEAEFFKPQMFPSNGLWRRFDTCGALYHALIDRAHVFTPRELDSYDHLFCGTHLDNVLMLMDQSLRDVVRSTHDQARTDYRGLRGIWRWQEEYFRSLERNVAERLAGVSNV